ncbi:MAG: hypothetical protein Q8Q56_03315, partial [Alphaproteobacteria bacterium]|nr:hypothetical protein [Alphaproteobacteria bacterium]
MNRSLPSRTDLSTAAFIQAVEQQTQRQITSGALQANSISTALVTSLAAARRQANSSLVPAGSGAFGIVGDSSASGLSLANTLELLPTTTALDILSVAQDFSVKATSTARKAALPLLRLTDGGNAANIPVDPAMEIESFVEKYRPFIQSDPHKSLLSQLKSNIEDILVESGHFRRFASVPEPTGESASLQQLCALPEGYAPLLYAANDQDEIVVPLLVDYILNTKKLANRLSYHANGPSGDGSIRRFEGLADGNLDLYKQFLTELGGTVDAYLSSLRQGVFGLIYPAAETRSIDGLSATITHDLSSNVSLRTARTAATGSADLAAFKMNGVSGQSIDLGLP